MKDYLCTVLELVLALPVAQATRSAKQGIHCITASFWGEGWRADWEE